MEYVLFILVGLFVIVNTIIKPSYFWNHRKAKSARKLFGNKITTIIYLAIGGLLTGIGVIMGVMTVLNVNEFLGMPLR